MLELEILTLELEIAFSPIFIDIKVRNIIHFLHVILTNTKVESTFS